MKLVVLLLLLCFIVFAEASGCFGCFSKKGKKSKANKGTPSDTPPHEINTSNEQGASTVVSKEENPAEKPEDKDQEVKSRNPIKVNKWNAQEVRVSLDDLVAKYFVEEARYKEDSSLLNYKLLFVVALTIIGGGTAVYALKTPFVEGKLLVGIGSATYMAVLGLYTLAISFLMTPTCFRGIHPSTKRTIWIKSKLVLPEANYLLTLVDPKTGAPQKCTKSWNIGTWIHEDGKISGQAFCEDMEKFIRSDEFKAVLRTE